METDKSSEKPLHCLSVFLMAEIQQLLPFIEALLASKTVQVLKQNCGSHHFCTVAYIEIGNIFTTHWYKWMRLPGLEVTGLELQLF